ncbi:hypothetical protein NQ317_007747 [Molorchus minor]|uniref:Uncharacterized protein n=1 Tax=Molorchus minor TaxID=1323400 RepID=A0ABQ9JWG2_9CUCU|nr:hypothetical protein NQ317_007747 [Molorchus minor]
MPQTDTQISIIQRKTRIITSGGCMVGERLSSSGTHINVTSPVQCAVSAQAHHKTSTESVPKSVSRQSLLDSFTSEELYFSFDFFIISTSFSTTSADLVGCKLGMSKSRQSQSYQPQEQSYYSSSRDSIAYINRAANVGSAASELDLSRKARRKDLRGRLKLPTSVTLASSGEAPLLGSWRTAPGSTAGINPPSSNHLNSNSSCNGTESRYGLRRGDSYSSRLRAGSQNWSFVFDPAGRLCYYWSMVVSLAFLYNFWVIIYRFAFREIDCKSDGYILNWPILNCVCGRIVKVEEF